MLDDTIITYLLAGILPPDVVESIHTHILHPHAPFQIYKRRALVEAQRGLNAIYPFIQPFADRTIALVAENQGVAGLLVAMVLLGAVVAVVSLVHRVLMWCTRMAMRVVFWASVFAVAAWAWQRGPLETARDAVVMGSKIAGLLAGIGNFWLEEYNRYEGQQKESGGRGSGRSSGR